MARWIHIFSRIYVTVSFSIALRAEQPEHPAPRRQRFTDRIQFGVFGIHVLHGYITFRISGGRGLPRFSGPVVMRELLRCLSFRCQAA